VHTSRTNTDKRSHEEPRSISIRLGAMTATERQHTLDVADGKDGSTPQDG